MFAKLLKHEIKSTGGLLGLLSLGALGVGALGGLLLRYNMNLPAQAEALELISIVSTVVLPFIFIALFAYAFGSEIYLIVQFYKHKFTDRGYLTFTLPVRSWQIYLSSLLNMMLWMLVISVTTIVAFLCLFLIGFLDTKVWQVLQEVLVDMEFMWDSLRAEFENARISIGFSVVSFISSNVLTITSVTLGCVAAKKHKVLGMIGCYYGISMLTGALSSWLGSVILVNSEMIQVDMIMVPTLVVQLVAIVAGSLLSIWLMDRKLNLP